MCLNVRAAANLSNVSAKCVSVLMLRLPSNANYYFQFGNGSKLTGGCRKWNIKSITSDWNANDQDTSCLIQLMCTIAFHHIITLMSLNINTFFKKKIQRFISFSLTLYVCSISLGLMPDFFLFVYSCQSNCIYFFIIEWEWQNRINSQRKAKRMTE